MFKEIFSEDYVTVYYEKETGIGKVVWNGIISTLEKYQKPFHVLNENAAKGNPLRYYLSDARNQGVVSPDKRKWFENELFPKAVANGLKKAAVVTDSNVFKRYYINTVLKSVKKLGIPIKLFAEEDEAIEFLLKD